MAYSTPTYFSHGDTISAAQAQKWSDGLDAIHPMIGDDKIQFVQFYSNMDTAQRHYIVHKKRYLITKSTGELRHPADPTTYPSVSIGDEEPFAVNEVDGMVDWLVPGMLYEVRGCSFACEDDEGIIASA